MVDRFISMRSLDDDLALRYETKEKLFAPSSLQSPQKTTKDAQMEDNDQENGQNNQN